MNLEAWIFSWDVPKAEEYARQVGDLCDVETHILCRYDHESSVFNEAIRRCKTDYIWLLTVDVDIIYPQTASLMVEYLEHNGTVGVLCPNREGEAPYVGGRWPYDKYLADNTAIVYRRSVGAEFDPEYVFAGWNDLDFGEEVKWRGHKVQVDPRISVNKHFTPYGSWTGFRRAFNARNRLLLEAKWCWVGRENWQGVDYYNEKAPPEARIPTMFEMSCWSEEYCQKFADSVNHEHPQLLLGEEGNDPGNLKWRMPDA
jgi:hypothetical protein